MCVLKRSLGADVSHPGPDTENRPSIVGMVSSVDRHMCRYVASTAVQGSRVEIIEDIDTLIQVMAMLSLPHQ